MADEFKNKPDHENSENPVPQEEKEHLDQVPEDLDEYLENFCPEDGDLISRDCVAESLKSVENKLDRIDDNFQQVWRWCENQTQTLEHYLEMVAECQKETAKFANNQFERHALHPAIEAVEVLARQIQDLLLQTDSLSGNEFCCSFVRPIVDSIKQAAQIADGKCKSLDMEMIRPVEFDELDPDKHEVRQAVPTDDRDQHKKVQTTLIPGLLYRGKVLRQARVSVYRYVQNEEQN